MIVVVFPAPLLPNKATVEDSSIEKFKFLTALIVPKFFERFFTFNVELYECSLINNFTSKFIFIF